MDMTTVMGQEGLRAEVSIIGSIAIEPLVIGPILARLKPDDFSYSVYRHLFEAAQELYLSGQPVDPVTIVSKAGDQYFDTIRECMAVTPTTANWESYASIMQEHTLLSKIQVAAVSIADATDLEGARAALASAEGLLCTARRGERVSFAQGLREFLDRQAARKAPDYLPWGVRALDEHIYAEPGDFIILAGEPSTGKTLLAAQFAFHQATRKRRVAIYSLETKAAKLYDRLFAGVGKMPFEKIKRYSMDDNALVVAAKELGYYADKITLDVIPAAGYSVADIQADALSNRYDIVYIDYVQLISGPGEDGSYERVTSVSIGLHRMSQRTGIAVIGLSQLSRPDKAKKARSHVRMSDLRSSGQLEQDADCIMALTLDDSDDKKGPRNLEVIKNKEGEADGFVKFAFDGTYLELRPVSTRRPPDFAPKMHKIPDDVQLEMPFEEVTPDAST